MQEIQEVRLDELRPSPFNQRDLGDLTGMMQTIEAEGVLQRIKVRRVGKHYETIFGHRRVEACRQLGVKGIGAEVVEMDDHGVIRVQIIENLQRLNVSPLEEAGAFKTLTMKGNDVATIAEDVGKSPRHIYDRLGLLRLAKEGKDLLRSRRITPGHAILISRLKMADQKRLIKMGLFTAQHLLWDPQEADGKEPDIEDSFKPVSVRELAAWIDENIRFDPKIQDLPELFPETAQVMTQARTGKLQFIPITWDHHVRPEAKPADGARTWGPGSWKKAKDECDHSVVGLVVVGPGRGDAFPVCTAKKKCSVHWASEQLTAKKRAKQAATGDSSGGQSKEAARVAREKAAEDERKTVRARWLKAKKHIVVAVAEAVGKADAGATGPLASVIIKRVKRWDNPKPVIPLGKTAEDLVRHAAMMILKVEITNEYSAPAEFPKIAKTLGVDVRKLLDEHAPLAKPKAKARGLHALKTADRKKAKALRKVKSKKRAAKRGKKAVRRKVKKGRSQ